jgi:HAMP domain-containing protein
VRAAAGEVIPHWAEVDLDEALRAASRGDEAGFELKSDLVTGRHREPFEGTRSLSTPSSPPTIPPQMRRRISGPPTIPLQMRVVSAPSFTPFLRPRFPAGVSGGPLVALLALLAGAAALSAIAVGGGGWPDWWLPRALVVVAAVGYVLVWAGLVAPVRRFGAAMARMAIEGRVELVVSRARVAELDRVALALYRFRGSRLGRRSSRSRGVPLAVAPCLAALLVLGWVVVAATATVGGAVPAPAELVREVGVRADERAAELDSAVRGGLAALQRAADPPTGGVVTDPGTTAGQILAAQPLFRSVSVVDRAGRPIAIAGLPLGEPVTALSSESRVVQANTAGSEPLVRASTPMRDGASVLVAEFDPRALNTVIRAGGSTRVVDPQRATVLDSGGYTAFAPLDDPALEALAGTVPTDSPRAEQLADGRVAAARLVSPPGAPTDLGWVLIEEQDVAIAAFADDGSRRGTIVVIAVSASVAVGALAWTMVTVVLPARRLARHVERLAAGDEVPPLAPQRLDELGTAVAATNRFVAAHARLDEEVRS